MNRTARRRILIIGIDYYEYTSSIVAELRSRGDEVTYAQIEKTSFYWRTCKRFAKKHYQRMLDRYHHGIIEATVGADYDIVLFVQAHHFSAENLLNLRARLSGARFILYNWDSLRTHDYSERIGYFDRVFTFDRADAELLGIDYHPLFALPHYFSPRPEARHEFDVYFVGSLVTASRVEAIRKFDAYCRAEGLKFIKHGQCSPPMFFHFLRRGLYFRGMTLRSLKTPQIVGLMHRSAAVFDVPNHQQSGFTMRMIENMCAGKMIITSSRGVREAPFFDPDQFLIVEDHDFSGVKKFLSAPTDHRVRHVEYSIGHWIDRVIG